MARISAAEAQSRMSQYMRDKTGKNRRVPPVNEAIQDIARKTVHVFNVGPWGYRENGGSFGYFFIPACEVGAAMEWERLKAPSAAPGVYVPDHWEEGDRRVTNPHTEYAAVKPLPGLMMEPMPNTQEDCVWGMQDTGEYFAKEILLKIGIGHSFKDSNQRRGVFLAAGKTPTADELNAAREELSKYMTDLVLEADRAWAAGPQKAEQVIRPEIHHICAHWLNLTDRDWLRGTKPQGRIKCAGCGELVDEGIAMCSSGHIVNADAFREFTKQQEAIKKALA
jgi:hypothetical protein